MSDIKTVLTAITAKLEQFERSLNHLEAVHNQKIKDLEFAHGRLRARLEVCEQASGRQGGVSNVTVDVHAPRRTYY